MAKWAFSCAFGRLVGYASEQSLPMHLQTNAAAWRSPVDRFMHSPDVSEAKIDTDAPHCPQQPGPSAVHERERRMLHVPVVGSREFRQAQQPDTHRG